MTRQLHIGGTERAEGWEVFNANPAPCVDHVGNANDLARFADHSFACLYASHVVEHLDYKGELRDSLVGHTEVKPVDGNQGACDGLARLWRIHAWLRFFCQERHTAMKKGIGRMTAASRGKGMGGPGGRLVANRSNTREILQ